MEKETIYFWDLSPGTRVTYHHKFGGVWEILDSRKFVFHRPNTEKPFFGELNKNHYVTQSELEKGIYSIQYLTPEKEIEWE